MNKLVLILAVLVATNTYSQTPITDANFHEAIENCLETNPVDGMCINSEYGPMPDWDVSNVTNMSDAFAGKFDFNGDISSWKVGNVKNMSTMFFQAWVFNSNISSWNVNNVTDMSAMFYNAFVFNKDISNWHVSNVTDMSSMFFDANVFNSDLTNWDVSNVVFMNNMFLGADVFNSDISAWDVSNVINMSYMFYSADVFNSDISAWDISNVTETYSMFTIAPKFNKDLSSWNITNIIDMERMFDKSGLSTANFDAILSGWEQQDIHSDITLGAEGVNYCNSLNARQSLIDNFGWTIEDEGYDCTSVDVADLHKLEITTYPNPTAGVVLIEGNKNANNAVVTDMLGKELMNQFVQEKLDISHLSNGIYLLILSDGIQVSTHKIIKN